MATAQSVPDFRNAPAMVGGAIVVPNQAAFEEKTEQNKKNLGRVAWPGFNSFCEVSLPKRGVYDIARVRFVGTVVVDSNTGSTTVLDAFPYHLIGLGEYIANGTAVHRASGLAYNIIRMQEGRCPTDFALSATASDPEHWESAADTTPADGTYDIDVSWDIPFAIDRMSGIGSTYAESDGSTFSLTLHTPPRAELFTLAGDAAEPVVDGYFYTELGFFDVPRDNIDGREVIYVPDLSRLYMIQEKKHALALGENALELTRSNGNLMRVNVRTRNGASGGSFQNATFYESIAWNYGLNQTPRIHTPTKHKMVEDLLHYGGEIPHSAFALDFKADNPKRDAVRPRSVTDLNVVLDIPDSATLTAGACHAWVTEETLIKAANSSSVTVSDTPQG